MENAANFADAVRQTFEAYTEALSAVMKALEQLPKQGGDAHRQTVEQWLALARMSKESVVAAINQGFDLWERECRRLVGAPHSPGPASVSGAMIDALAESWRVRRARGQHPGGDRERRPVGSGVARVLRLQRALGASTGGLTPSSAGSRQSWPDHLRCNQNLHDGEDEDGCGDREESPRGSDQAPSEGDQPSRCGDHSV